MISNIENVMTKIASQQIIKSIRQGLLFITPFLIIGSIMLAILNFPVPFFQDFLDRFLGPHWRDIGLAIHKGTLQIMSIAAMIGISYAIAIDDDFVRSGKINPTAIIITVLACYIAFVYEPDTVLSARNAGSVGLFTAMVTAIGGTKLFIFFYKQRDKLRPENPLDYNGNTLVRLTFRVVLPAMLTILLFAIARQLFTAIGFQEITREIPEKFYALLVKHANFFSVFILTLTTHIFWAAGVHGGNFVMDAIPDIAITIPAAAAGAVNEVMVKRMLDTFVHLGGAGATIGLLAALLLAGKKHNETFLAKSSIIPGIFNINESIIYGLPVIYNPYLFIPFLSAPIILSLISYIAFWFGLVPPIVNPVGWTTPVFLSGYLSTGSIRGTLLQGLNLAVSVAMYVPFIKLQQKNQEKNRLELYKSFSNEILKSKDPSSLKLLTRYDDIGGLARELAEEIRQNLKPDSKALHIEYQPKVNYEGKVIGAEALMRWNHPFYGPVAPPLILKVAEEAGLMNKLGSWCIEQAFRELSKWHGMGFDTLSLSANLNPKQLEEDDNLVGFIFSCIESNNLNPRFMELELTENAAVDPDVFSRNKLEEIKSMGIAISIDDFGMGHSSLLYLVDLFATIVKIDRLLVKDIAHDKDRRKIIESIIHLCRRMNVKVIAEGVETSEQAEVLNELGCHYFQGFYFSKSLRGEAFLQYVTEHGVIEGDDADEL
ncbi:EAL domain-containing protein [Treponema sp. OttesenSCG-928-L16]|nr:EAL domain-containing protein [Treponema sp. OttesenSCG-928-L16]